MIFTYLKTPLNKYTFKSKKIREWVESVCYGRVLNLFAGMTKLDTFNTNIIQEFRNDIREEMDSHYHMDALEWVKNHTSQDEYVLFHTVLLDPPSSYRKSMEFYGGKKMSPFNSLKDEIVKLLMPHGIVVTFGYHSVSMGQSRGFEVEHICLMSHGGAIHDTIATVERKIN